jgi:hypothetical protein
MTDTDFESNGNPATGAKEQIQEVAQSAGSRTQEVVRNQIDERSTQVGDEVTSVAEGLRAVGDQLREQENSRGAQLATQAADRAETVGGYLRDSDADRLLRDAEDFGRRQPLLVLGGSLILGIAAARFLKASSQKRYESGPSASGGQVSPPAIRSVPEPQLPNEPVGVGAGASPGAAL